MTCSLFVHLYKHTGLVYSLVMVYARFHRNAAPGFSAEEAWSIGWGYILGLQAAGINSWAELRDRANEIAEECAIDLDELSAAYEVECALEDCAAPRHSYSILAAYVTATRGYSCCAGETAEEAVGNLRKYFAGRGTLDALADDGQILVFEGQEQGLGEDGEYLVVPTGEPTVWRP